MIAANAELRERELIKMASLAAALADGLRRRGVAEPDASLAAEAGDRRAPGGVRALGERAGRAATSRDVMRDSLDQLKTVTARS